MSPCVAACRALAYRGVAWGCAAALLVPPGGLPPRPALAQPAAAADAPADSAFSQEQLDALLAPVALYPDALLMQVLMACAWPLQVVEAARWVASPANAALRGDALATALQPLPWNPAVKSLVPFPTVLATLNARIDWMRQLGDAFATQQGDVLESVQRLRRQAQDAGNLRTTPQQVVSDAGDDIAIVPADPQTVYVPVYDSGVVYGDWPYADRPPVVLPPPAGYDYGSVLVTGLAFAVGVGIVASLWGLGSPNWRRRHVNIDVDRWNRVNLNRPRIDHSDWRAPPRFGSGEGRPPSEPVGPPRPVQVFSPYATGRPVANFDVQHGSGAAPFPQRGQESREPARPEHQRSEPQRPAAPHGGAVSSHRHE